MASVHKECGADITWARRDDDPSRFMPPLEYVGEVFLIEGVTREDKTAVQRHAYRLHICDPDRIIEWQDYMRRLAEAKGMSVEELNSFGGASHYEAAREKESEENWNMALMVSCTRCDAPKGEKCRSLATKHIKTGEIVETRNPHPVRLEAFYFMQSGKDPDATQGKDED